MEGTGGGDAVLRAEVVSARRRLGAPALGAALVGPGGTVVAVAGVRARGGDDPALPGDPWHIGSCGKAFTAALLARLAARADVAWEATLPSLLPALRGHVDPGWDSVTLESLLRHRAGLPANLPPALLLAAHDDPRPVAVQREEVAARALAAPPRRPGRFVYSNLGYIVAGAVAEAATGTSWEEALHEELLAPLGITGAGHGAPPGDAPRGHPPRHLRLMAGRGPALAPGAPWEDNPPVMGPAGRLHMPLADWGRFAREFLADGPSVLRPEDVARLLAPAPGRGPAYGMGWVRPGLLAPRHPLRVASHVHQGSNRSWSATIALGPGRRTAALVAADDGRGRVLAGTASLAGRLLAGPP